MPTQIFDITGFGRAVIDTNRDAGEQFLTFEDDEGGLIGGPHLVGKGDRTRRWVLSVWPEGWPVTQVPDVVKALRAPPSTP
jgi:hypothetical protein